jgi:hypothetical protein
MEQCGGHISLEKNRSCHIIGSRSGFEPERVPALDPIQNAGTQGPQRRNVLGQKRQPERKHPDAEDRQKGKDASNDQQQTCGNPQPEAGRPPQETDSRTQPAWQAIDELLKAPIVAIRGNRDNFLRS